MADQRKPRKRRKKQRECDSLLDPMNFGDATALDMIGSDLASEEADELEVAVDSNPNDLASRIKLLGYYARRQYSDKAAAQQRIKHIIWIVDNLPECPTAGDLAALVVEGPKSSGNYEEVKSHWLKQIDQDRPVVLGNAAHFFIHSDIETSESLLLRAQALDPENPHWSERLSHLYHLWKKPVERLRSISESLALETREHKVFYKMSDLASAQFAAGEIIAAEETCGKLLMIAENYKDDWNYGNAVHIANIVLGRVCLNRGDVSAACDYLLRAGDTPGSPQLNSFGPKFGLARDLLLEHDEREVVIQYLKRCSQFWKMGKRQLKEWIEKLKNGETPDLFEY